MDDADTDDAGNGPGLPRPEYPRPHRVRDAWLNLNGEWSLAYDPDDVGLDDAWFDGGPSARRAFSRRVVVPFCLESVASGVADPAPPRVVWYRRSFRVPDAWVVFPRLVLHVGACDYEARVFVNGLEVGRHQGGYAPFACDIGHALIDGDNTLTVRVAESPLWTRPRGKQAGTMRWPIDYDPVSGIWQTVWLEPLPAPALADLRVDWDAATGTAQARVLLSELTTASVRMTLREGDRPVASVRSAADDRRELRLTLPVAEPRLWSPADPFLYDVDVVLEQDGAEIDRVRSYAGLRTITVRDGTLTLNGRPLYLRGVLDQGYFPDGWYTPVCDADLRRDVELTLALGFNLARKHQKAEDPRYLYWADRLGLLVWAEMPSGRIFGTELVTSLTREWLDLVVRDRGHPCIVGWVPFNESWGVWHQSRHPEQRAFVEALVHLTRALDPTRPVVGNDGWEYAAGDLWTLHLYDDGRAVRERVAALYQNPGGVVTPGEGGVGARVGALPGTDPRGLPCLLSECGGVGFVAPGTRGPADPFAYGALPADTAALDAAIAAIAADIGSAHQLGGFVWTQLTDVQQEVNGLLDFQRRPKLPLARLAEIFGAIGR